MLKIFCGRGISGLLALTLLASGAATVQAGDATGFGNESEAARIAYDAFNLSVRKRLAATRVGLANSTFAQGFSSGAAFAAAPSSRTGTVAGTRRRQIDCVYHTGFTIWGDYHQTWARQGNRDGGNGFLEDGYRYRHSAPALGVDWSNGNFTAGIAGTYGWGKLKSRQYNNERNVRAWGLQAYAQYDTRNFYGNLTFGYERNRYRSAGGGAFTGLPGTAANDTFDYGARYHGNSWNADAEFGYKFKFGGARLTPNVGLRYFHDRTGTFAVQAANYLAAASDRNYHTLELPVGLDFSYEIAAGGALLVPRLRAAWVPELSRRRPGVSAALYDTATPANGPWALAENTARRSRHGFEVGAGLEAKLTKSLSAHVDYEFGFRSKAQEHHLNVGIGFTF